MPGKIAKKTWDALKKSLYVTSCLLSDWNLLHMFSISVSRRFESVTLFLLSAIWLLCFHNSKITVIAELQNKYRISHHWPLITFLHKYDSLEPNVVKSATFFCRTAQATRLAFLRKATPKSECSALISPRCPADKSRHMRCCEAPCSGEQRHGVGDAGAIPRRTVRLL